MALRTFRIWIRITKVMAEFAKSHALLNRAHLSLMAFEEVASLIHQRKTNQQKIHGIEAKRRSREMVGRGVASKEQQNCVGSGAASSSTSPELFAVQPGDVVIVQPGDAVLW